MRVNGPDAKEQERRRLLREGLIQTHNPLKHYNRLSFWNSHYPRIPRNETRENTWKAFEHTPLEDVRCVILGDRTPSGVAFSALPHNRKIPRTTHNVIREYVSDLGYPYPRSGDFRPWCKRGVLLLPIQLGPSSEWRMLTFEVLRTLSVRKPGRVAFHLWGAQAQEFKAACDGPVFETSHPGALTCHDGFLGSKPFSWTNSVLETPIDWRL